MSDPIPEPDDQFTADMVAACGSKRLAIAEKKAEVLAHYIDGLNFCPDHRDKVRGRGRCMACDLETAYRRCMRLAEALRLLVKVNEDWDDAVASIVGRPAAMPGQQDALELARGHQDALELARRTLAAYAPEGGEESTR